jgi:Cu(I)/Ag(I) efflux system membrane fusion protein
MRIGKIWIVLLAGSLLGGLLVLSVVGMSSRTHSSEPAAGGAKYTCSMHPQIVIDHADTCPLCGMDLTPVRSGGGDGWEEEDPSVRLVLSEAAQKMADVGAVSVGRRELFQEIRAAAKVEVDETRVANVSAGLSGRVERIHADVPGVIVRQDQPLVSLFNFDLYTTQEQFLVAAQLERSRQQQARQETSNQQSAQPAPAPQTPAQEPARTERPQQQRIRDLRLSTMASPRRRLKAWGMTDKQLDELANSDQPQECLVVRSPIGGTILEKKVRLGQFVKEGDLLYTIADLSRVWVVFEVYESELSWLRPANSVQLKLESEPNGPTTGKIDLIEPILNDPTRTVRVRVIVDNTNGRFKPGMYAEATLRVPVLPSSHAGAATAQSAVLAVPAEAVLTTGRRQLVYLEVAAGKYELVEPKLGPRAGDYFPVISGLKEQDRVVTRGNFLLDSQFQVTGKASLLYPERTPAGHGDGLTAKQRANLEGFSEAERQEIAAQKICPMSGAKLASMGKPYKMTINGRTLWLCCKGCERGVKKDPEAAFKKLQLAQQKTEVSK